MKRQTQGRRAFTLVEVMLVVFIVAALATVAVVTLWPRQQEANINLTKAKIGKVMSGLQQYRLNLKQYPSEDQGLAALLNQPGDLDDRKAEQWKGPYQIASRNDLRDAWDNDLQYRLVEVPQGDTTRQEPRVYSFGPNGTDEQGEGDDIRDAAWEGAEAEE